MTAELYLGDCFTYMKTMNAKRVVLITDPPYGMSLETNYKDRKRTALAECNNFAPIIGDNKPFDPAPFLQFSTIVMFGPDHYAKSLPDGGTWLVWDKLDGLSSNRAVGFNDNSDCEFIWTNKGKASRIFRHRWMGVMKASEQTERRIHPTQKPIALMSQIIECYTKQDDVVFDPYMGSGTTGVAAVLLGRSFIGCELDPHYFTLCQERIARAQEEASSALFNPNTVEQYESLSLFDVK